MASTDIATTAPVSEKSQQEQLRANIINGLFVLGNSMQQEDDIAYEGTKIIIPATYQGRDEEFIRFMQQRIKDQKETYEFSKTFRYRPWDGAAAFQRALKKVFGTSGIGKKTYGFFGESYPPEYHNIPVGPNESIDVPWGVVSMDIIQANFTLGVDKDREYGQLFKLSVEAPKKWRGAVSGFFQVVEKELAEGSIYRGKAINGAAIPAFLDVANLDPNNVIYADTTMRQLGANLWSLLDYSDIMREQKIKLKRSVLLEGPYGTGKSLGGLLTAQRAQRNGWTFILVRPGQDNLEEALKTAQLYAPAVVWFEDVDTLSVGASATDMSKLLDILDSVSNKGVEVLAGFTTNHVERPPKGVLRPGRIDAIIHIGGLDVHGYQKLVESIIPEEFRGEIDYAAVAKAFLYEEVGPNDNITIKGVDVVKNGRLLDSSYGYVLREDGKVVREGFLPAFASEAISRAQRFVIEETGKPGVIETRHLVSSAAGLYRQRELMQAADEGVHRPSSLEQGFASVIKGAVPDSVIGKVRLDSNLLFTAASGSAT